MVFEKISCNLTGHILGLTGAVFRYEVLERLQRSAARRDVTVVSFGFAGNELRLVLEGQSDDIGNVLRGVKVGTTRSARKLRLRLQAGPSERTVLHRADILDAVVWTHLAPVSTGAAGPLSDPWSSHRDLMGFRHASFYDVSRLRQLVDPRVVHRLAGGQDLPQGWPPASTGREALSFLLRIAGGVLGVLTDDVFASSCTSQERVAGKTPPSHPPWPSPVVAFASWPSGRKRASLLPCTLSEISGSAACRDRPGSTVPEPAGQSRLILDCAAR